MNLCVIPARGGSKRIPRKNIKNFHGKPIIAWSITAAVRSECFDRIIVSTDDEEVAEISVAWGAETPFIRPAELANDYSGTTDVVAHAIDWQCNNGEPPSDICCIYATAPFIRSLDIKRGLELLRENKAEFAFSVTRYDFPIQRAVRITSENRLQMFQPEFFNTRSQDLEASWHDAGQFYWGKAEAWLAKKPLFYADSVPVILPGYRVQDIDTLEDWERAETLFQLQQLE
jgi:pseudaminic acid cytidylyltransferase